MSAATAEAPPVDLARVRALDEFLKDAGVARLQREHLTGRAAFDVDLVPPELRRWVATFPERLWKGGSVLLCGPVGSGKTLSACWVLAEVWRRAVVGEDGYPRGGRTPSCAFGRATDFRLAARERSYTHLRAMRRAQVLVLDDLGLEADPQGLTATDVDELIDIRWAEKRCTIVTSNLRGEAEEGPSFSARYPRAASRLLDARGPGLVELVRGDMRRISP